MVTTMVIEQTMRDTLGMPVSPVRSTARRQREFVIVTGLTLLMGAGSLAANLGPAFSGNIPAMGRAALGMLGVAAAAVLWMKPRIGWILAATWAAIQIPIYAWTTDGSPTTQIINLPLTLTSSVAHNGVITAYSSIGINLVGLALFIYLRNRRRIFA